MEVVPIKYEDTKEWCLKKHYAKRMPSISYSFGIKIDDTIIGIVTYGKPASNNLCVGVCGYDFSKYVYELNRLVINSDAPKNSASFLVGNSIKQMPKELIFVSYADTKMGHIGYVYQATNWIYTGATKARTDIAKQKDNSHSRHYDKDTVDYSQRVARSSKHRYVYSRNKKAIKELKYKVEQYPKGDTDRYDCIDIVKIKDTLF